MTDPKQPPAKGADPKGAKPAKPDEKKVFVRNNTKTPYVVAAAGSGASTTLRPNRVTAVSAEAWEKFKETPFGQALAEAESIEESNEEEHANQPESEQEKIAEADAADERAQRARTSKKVHK